MGYGASSSSSSLLGTPAMSQRLLMMLPLPTSPLLQTGPSLPHRRQQPALEQGPLSGQLMPPLLPLPPQTWCQQTCQPRCQVPVPRTPPPQPHLSLHHRALEASTCLLQHPQQPMCLCSYHPESPQTDSSC